MGGFAIQNSEGAIYSLNPTDFWALLSNSVIQLPEICEEEIEERSKADGLVKTIACIQVIYLVTQLIARAVQHLPVSTMELFTLAMIGMALFLYALWWHKPMDVRLPILLQPQVNGEMSEEIINGIFNKIQGRVQFSEEKTISSSKRFLLIGLLATATFGACHIIGWNFEFPTKIEQLLWRVASVACLAVPVGLLLINSSFLKDSDVLSYLFVTIYVIVRLYLVVEIFVGLRWAPAGVYETVNWSQFLPHM
jgi:hypothetical protein